LLVPKVAELLKRRETRHWLNELATASIPCGPINDIAQAFAEPQVVHREMHLTLPHPSAGTAPGVRNPIRFSRTAIEYLRAPPLLGQHTAELLAERLGLDEAEVQGLRQRHVVA